MTICIKIKLYSNIKNIYVDTTYALKTFYLCTFINAKHVNILVEGYTLSFDVHIYYKCFYANSEIANIDRAVLIAILIANMNRKCVYRLKTFKMEYI